MIHGILQFTPSIAFRYVLHRCESRDIRCRESLSLSLDSEAPNIAHRLRGEEGALALVSLMFLGAVRAVGSLSGRATGSALAHAAAAQPREQPRPPAQCL